MRFEDAWKKALGRDVPLAQGCIVVKKKTLEEHPEAVAAFLSAYKGSIAWVNENHGQAGVLIAKHKMGLDAEAAARAIPRMSLVYEPAQKARPSVEEFLNVLLKFSPASIGGRLPDSGFYLRLP
jgi:NitT/TauT family transport system substrate-binding protein